MRQSVGFTFLFNFFATFLVILIFVLASIMNYMKAYKVNSQIVSAIEKRGGINAGTKSDIEKILENNGYRKTTTRRNCGNKYGDNIAVSIPDYEVCFYLAKEGDVNKLSEFSSGRTFQVGVLTYIYFDMPIIQTLLRIPVYTATDNIYIFPGKVRK